MNLERLYISKFAIGLSALALLAGGGRADEPTSNATPPKPASNRPEPQPLNQAGTVLLDKPGGRLLLKTHVAQREGLLEMLCCLKQTKEHESILALDAKAYVVHTGLLALGAKTGTPVSYRPEYRAPTGQKIEIFVNWAGEQGKSHRVPAKSWVRNATRRFWSTPMIRLPAGVTLPKNTELRYDNKLKELSWYGPMTEAERDRFLAISQNEEFRKAVRFFFDQSQPREMQADWVFAGSGIFTDEETGKEFYLAEEGDLICVANFPGATIDVAVASSSQADALLFEAYTERIPPKDTPVTLELIPVLDKSDKADESRAPIREGQKATGDK